MLRGKYEVEIRFEIEGRCFSDNAEAFLYFRVGPAQNPSGQETPVIASAIPDRDYYLDYPVHGVRTC